MASRPNILVIMTDEHPPDLAGFAGDPYVRTQHLDPLAARSVQFDTALYASPVCTPSRMCVMASKEVQRCGAWRNHWIFFPEHLTWPQHFANHGYRTCAVGKMHFGFSWDDVHRQLAVDRERLPEFFSGMKPSTPNRYMLRDGRVFDAEGDLYGARWLTIPPEALRGGIIPQMFG